MTMNKSPLDMVGKNLADKREQKTKDNSRNSKIAEHTVVRAEKSQVKEIKRLILDYEKFASITDFVVEAIEEKLQKERKKHS